MDLKTFEKTCKNLLREGNNLANMILLHNFLFLNKNKVDYETWKAWFKQYREWSDKRVLELRERSVSS